MFSRVKLMPELKRFHNIGLVGRPGHAGVLESVERLQQFLLSAGVQVIVDPTTANMLPLEKLQVCEQEHLGAECDLVIVVGGDGSILKAAQVLAEPNIPVLGVNRGRLGFLTDILPEELEQAVQQVLQGKYKTESRFLLEVTAKHDKKLINVGCALNDVVLHPGKAAQMIAFELFVDDEFVYSQQSDGLIVATPTGSTAYSMSAGGPIMHPKLDAVVLVPMYPHALGNRPIVIDANSEIRIVVAEKHTILPQISCDGEVKLTTIPGDEVIVRKKAHQLQLIHPLDHNYYETCRSKLGWGHRLDRQ